MKCSVSKKCGGCSLLHMEYKQQFETKKNDVADLLRQNRLPLKIDRTIPARKSIGYRNKIIVAFAKRKGHLVSGMYAPHSHDVIPVKSCLMHPKRINELIMNLTEWLDSMNILLYNERTGTGLLRHVVIRYAEATGEIMVVFVTAKGMFPSRRNLVNRLVKEFPEVTSVMQSYNTRNTSVVLENESFLLYGNPYITDELCGYKFSFSADCFYQVHHDQCEALYTLAKKKLDLKKSDILLDTYCGIGTIGLTMADSCKQVIGVERNRQSVHFARQNAKQNNIENARFLTGDSTQFMKQAVHQHNHFDAVILDPPRSGTTPDFIMHATGLNPEKILYISCDPLTLARDLKMFFRSGYKAKTIDLVDMFPNTKHVESVVLLTRS